MYWTKTESFESIKRYIGMNFDGLKDKIIQMLEGEPLPIWVQAFNNTMNELNDVNDVLTLLIHLGYLGYNNVTKTAFIPNEEVRQLLECAVRSLGWQDMILVGVNYDKDAKDKVHECIIEDWQKE